MTTVFVIVGDTVVVVISIGEVGVGDGFVVVDMSVEEVGVVVVGGVVGCRLANLLLAILRSCSICRARVRFGVVVGVSG